MYIITKVRVHLYLQQMHAYLESEGHEVHEVVEMCGAFEVSTVDVHCVAELVAPGSGVDAQRVQIHVGRVDESVEHAAELCEKRAAGRWF